MLSLLLIILSIFALTSAQDKDHATILTNVNPIKVIESHVYEPIQSYDDHVQFIHNIKDFFTNGEILLDQNKDNSTCVKSIETMMADLKNAKGYSAKMLDAWGKPECGILVGNIVWEGRYFECKAVESQEKEFRGKWCSANIGSKNSGSPLPGFPAQVGINLGVCFPSTCSTDNITSLFSGILVALNVSTVDVTVYCPPEPHQWDAKTVIAVIITCIMGLMVILGTAVEMYNYRRNSLEDDEPLLDATENPRQTMLSKTLLSFSLAKNTNNFLSTEQREGNIHCLHGMRFISMTWVVLGHCFALGLSGIDNGIDLGNYTLDHFSFMAILNATFSVDTFFFLSGLLATFLGLREIKKLDGHINIPLMYLGRYLRLTPVYAYCILFSVSIFLIAGDGPNYALMGTQLTQACSKYWWTNLLYINNLYPVSMTNECFSWGWYLANDMQFYLTAPFFIILLYRKPKLGLISLTVGILCSIAITGALSSYYGVPSMVEQAALMAHVFRGDGDFPTFIPKGNATATQADVLASDIYAKPWCRIGVYFVGMITGYILHVTKGNIKMNKITVAVGWTIATVMELALVYGSYGHVTNGNYLSNNAAAFYNAVSRPLWAVGLAWVVIACVCGYGGPVNRFLSWRAFIPLSRLTYSSYLLHILVLEWIFFSSEVQIHFSITLFVVIFLAALVLTNGVAYAVSMLVEVPFQRIQNIIFPRKHKLRSEADNVPKVESAENESLST